MYLDLANQWTKLKVLQISNKRSAQINSNKFHVIPNRNGFCVEEKLNWVLFDFDAFREIQI